MTLTIPPLELSTTSRASSLSVISATTSPVATLAGANALHKEVGPELMGRGRTRHRKDGDVPYPLQYGQQRNELVSPPLSSAIRRRSHPRKAMLSTISFCTTSAADSHLRIWSVPNKACVLDIGCGGGDMDTGCSAALDSERLTFSICWDRNIIYLQDCSFVGLDHQQAATRPCTHETRRSLRPR